jgi:hypothetical protein
MSEIEQTTAVEKDVRLDEALKDYAEKHSRGGPPPDYISACFKALAAVIAYRCTDSRTYVEDVLGLLDAHGSHVTAEELSHLSVMLQEFGKAMSDHAYVRWQDSHAKTTETGVSSR